MKPRAWWDAAWVRALAGLAAGIGAALLCAWLRTPIPWMLGPLFGLALLRVAGLDLTAPRGSRYVGQWIIGTALGLYFSPAVLRHIAAVWYLPLIGALVAVGIGYLAGAILAKVARIDRTTALFASVPGGASEMATLGDAFGARPDHVTAAQSLRMLLVVAIVPAAFTLLEVHGSDATLIAARGFDAMRLAGLMAATLVGAFAARALRLPNAFMLGALLVSIPASAMELPLSAVPTPLSNAGQMLLGLSLGSRFRRDFLQGAPRFLFGVVVSIVAAVVVSAAIAWVLARLTGQSAATLILGMAPGGVAEMAITAKVLQLGVPLVTAFHVTRLIVLLMVTAPLFRYARGWRSGR